LGRIFTASKAN